MNYVVIALEVVGVLAILVPSLSAPGAITLSLVMLGTVILGGSPLPAVVLGVGILIAHRDQVLEYTEMRGGRTTWPWREEKSAPREGNSASIGRPAWFRYNDVVPRRLVNSPENGFTTTSSL